MTDGNSVLTDGRDEKGRGREGCKEKAQMEVRHLYFDADLCNVSDVQIHAAMKDVEK